MAQAGRGRGGFDRGGDRRGQEQEESEFSEEVIFINRVAKVVKGGRKFSFTALVAIGDKKNRVGLGYGKASEAVDAIRKGVDEAKRNLITVYKEGTTVPYEVQYNYSSSRIVILRPAKKGHGIIAGGAARPILHLAGYEDVSAKYIGSNNPINTARAAFNALRQIQTPEYIMRLRSGEKVDSQGRFFSDVKKQRAEEAIEQFNKEEAAAALAEDGEGQKDRKGKSEPRPKGRAPKADAPAPEAAPEGES